jgi:TIR domain
MLNIFVSYRRDDSAGFTGRLVDSLEPLLGAGNIFRDVEGINPGENFVKVIEKKLKQAKVTLIVIGKNWLNSKDSQEPSRLANPNDFVRLEIETALRYKHQIIPILVDNAMMPKAEELPTSIAPLAFRQAIVMTDSGWDGDIQRLFKILTQAKQLNKSFLRQWLQPVTNKFRYITLSIGLLLFAGSALFLAQRFFQAPDLSGNWYFKDGNYLLIKQDHEHVEVEHIDPAMQTTYDKGKGIIKGRRLEFNLEPIYTDKYRYRGNFKLAWDNSRLEGELIEVLSDEVIPLELNRAKPAQK